MNIPNNMRERVWLVWSPTGHAPHYRHDSKQSAVTEARRLATCNPGQDFFVLRAETAFCLPRELAPVELQIIPPSTRETPW
jgi:hypothetical protein